VSQGGIPHLYKLTWRNFRCNACSQAQAKMKEASAPAADPVEKAASK
jgi:hypothetical protein